MEDIIGAVNSEVYENIISRDGREKAALRAGSFPFCGPTSKLSVRFRDEGRRWTPVLAFGNYVGHPWLDASTHPDYENRSAFDVFELGSLKDFPLNIKLSLAYRIADHVVTLARGGEY